MCGNGVVIGMEITLHRPMRIQRDQPQALFACIVAVAGTAMRATVECRIAATMLPTTATATLVFG